MSPEDDAGTALNYSIIENGIRLGLRRQDELTTDFAKTGDDLATAEIAYKKAYAIARVGFRSQLDPITKKRYTQDALEDLTTGETIEEYSTLVRAKAVHDAARQALNSVRTRLDNLRSLMASYRALTD